MRAGSMHRNHGHLIPGNANALRPLAAAVLVLVTASVWIPRATAAPQLDFIEPAGVQRGQRTVVTLAGKFPNWPVTFEVDGAGASAMEIKPEKASGKVSIAVTPDAPAGPVFIRARDKDGLSEPRAFVIGTLPDAAEKEPNDRPGEAMNIAGNTVINGKLAKRGDVDAFRVKLAAGQTLVASLQANSVLASPMDGVLQVCDDRGFVLAQNDEGVGLDPRAVFKVKRDGEYVVRLFAFPETPNSSISFAGGSNFVYRLTLATGPFASHVAQMGVDHDGENQPALRGWNLEGLHLPPLQVSDREAWHTVWHPRLANTVTVPVDTAPRVVSHGGGAPKETPVTLDPPCIAVGLLQTRGQADRFQFKAGKGDRFRFQVMARQLGSPLDAVIKVHDTSGKVLATLDDLGKTNPDPTLAWTARADGAYVVSVSDAFGKSGPWHAYRMQVLSESAKGDHASAWPRFALHVTESSFRAPPGKPVEIDVSVERFDRYREAIEIALEPVGKELAGVLNCKPVASLGTGASAKAVKLKVTAAKPFLGRVRIVGRVKAPSTGTKTGKSSGKTTDKKSATPSVTDVIGTYRIKGWLPPRDDLWLSARPAK